MQWYVLQTRTGEEEKLVDLVHKLVPDYLYGTCCGASGTALETAAAEFDTCKTHLSWICVYYF